MSARALQEQVGQLLILGFDGTSSSGRVGRLWRELQPGGVILFQRNIETPRQTWTLLRDAQRAVPWPQFLCVDLEGGTVDRLKKVLAPAPSAADVASTGRPDFFRLHGRLLGREARALGFNVDFAPCFDLAFPASRAVMGSRLVSSDAGVVTRYAREVLRGLAEANVLGCGKHFPGLGEGDLDSHHALPVIRRPLAKMLRQDLVPYRELRRQVAFVMVAHAGYPEVTGDETPASLSPRWMRDVLRQRLGFRNLVVSDDLEMGGVLAAGDIGDVAVRTVAAGADMFLVCHQEEMVRAAWEAVLREAERSPAFARRVNEAARSVLAFKKRAKPLRSFPAAPTQRSVRELRTQMQEFTVLVAAGVLATAQRRGAGR